MRSVKDIPHFSLDTHHFGHTGPVDIRIEYSHDHLFFKHCRSQIHDNAGLSHTALTADNGDLVIDMGHCITDRAMLMLMPVLGVHLEIFVFQLPPPFKAL